MWHKFEFKFEIQIDLRNKEKGWSMDDEVVVMYFMENTILTSNSK